MRLWWKAREHNADLLAYEGEFLTLQVDDPLPLEVPVEVEAHVPDQEGLFHATVIPTHEVQPDAALGRLIESLHYAPRRHLYCARLQAPQEGEGPLRVLLDQLPSGSSHHHRLESRLARKLRVFSAGLPEGRGMTMDISRTGLSLWASGPVETGVLLPLSLIFDEAQYPALQLQARVCWCRPLPPSGSRPRGFLLGAHFEELSPAQARALGNFVQAALHKDPLASRALLP